MRITKLGGTLGPACDDPAVLAGLLGAGLDLARINFSHGEPEDARRRVRRFRRAARDSGRTVALLGDLQGPRFRIGTLPGGRLELEPGAGIDVIAGTERSPAGTLPVPWPALSRQARRGTTLRIDDGNVVLRVESVRGARLRCRVERGGPVGDRKGINLPGAELAKSAFTAKDRRDLALAAELRCDALLVSFVRGASDVRLARRLLERAGSTMAVVAKIERPEALDRLAEILDAADGVLVARGDLGVELPLERLPGLQKEVLAAARAVGKRGIVAAHLLASMTVSDRPARSEVIDVANAVLDGASALLLTGETAVGAHPVAAVEAMARIVDEAESWSERRGWWS
ncbi:MAG TPA: pyruvate kinase [Candidatus Polarisedimenticolaceae bacterium]